MCLAVVLAAELALQFWGKNEKYGVANLGISFGAFPGIGTWLLLSVWIVLASWYYKHRDRISILLILFGGAGNLIARFMFGSVWDYIYLPFLPFWFNLSDLLITGGVLLYLIWDN